MKKNLAFSLVAFFMLLISCRKYTEAPFAGSPTSPFATEQTKTFSSQVAQKWQDMQVRILRLPQGPSPYGMNGNRYFAYLGIGLYESVVPGMEEYQSLSKQLTDMPAMPPIEPNQHYYWPASANAALAFLNKNFYTLASDADKAAMDSLDNALQREYKTQTDAETFERSANFGSAVFLNGLKEMDH
jgi:hypothetical protein